MSKLPLLVLAAVALTDPGLTVAREKPSDFPPKPNSFIPRHKAGPHVYGSPIHPALVGHRVKTARHRHPPK